MLESPTIMGRKKSYKKNQNPNKPQAAPGADDGDEDDATPDPSDTVIVTTAEVAETATSTVAALTGGTQAPTTDGPVDPQAITGRPEWAKVAPARLEAAEEEAFWFAFSLAVMACSPVPLAAPAALVAAVLAGRILRALWSVPADVAPDDLGSARTMLFMVALLAVFFKVGGGGGGTGMIWVMLTVFFFNALRNVRTMVTVALTKGGKKKKEKKAELEEAKS